MSMSNPNRSTEFDTSGIKTPLLFTFDSRKKGRINMSEKTTSPFLNNVLTQLFSSLLKQNEQQHRELQQLHAN